MPVVIPADSFHYTKHLSPSQGEVFQDYSGFGLKSQFQSIESAYYADNPYDCAERNFIKMDFQEATLSSATRSRGYNLERLEAELNPLRFVLAGSGKDFSGASGFDKGDRATEGSAVLTISVSKC